MRVKLPPTSATKLLFNEREFALVLTKLKDPEATEPIPVAYNYEQHWFEVDDEYKITEEEVKAAYKKFKHDETWNMPEWKRRMRELFVKDEKGTLTDEEEAELLKLERRDRKVRLGVVREEE